MSLFRRFFGKEEEPAPAPVEEDEARPVPRSARPRSLSGLDVKDFLRQHPNVVLDMWAPWCRPCRALAPIVERAAQQFAGDVAFGKVNIDRDPSLAQRWEVQSIPTLLFFHEGELVKRQVGILPPDAFEKKIRRTFGL